jgi:phage baseplate assembly protein W
MADDAPFIGRGWAFPPVFTEGGGEVEMVSGNIDVVQAMQIIFATEPGERPMRETFGSSLSRHMFDEIDQSMLTSIRGAILDAILAFEPRVEVNNIEIAESGDETGLLTISLHYTLRGTNSRYNLVYPFYIREAATTAQRGSR